MSARKSIKERLEKLERQAARTTRNQAKLVLQVHKVSEELTALLERMESLVPRVPSARRGQPEPMA